VTGIPPLGYPVVVDMDLSKPLDLIDVTRSDSAGVCGPDGCGCGHGAEAATEASASAVSTEIGVAGMTCSHCVSSVTEELSELPGVESVAVDLVAGGVSRVSIGASGPLDPAAVRAAIEEAGYSLAE